MSLHKLLAACDHTNLSPTATWEDIRRLCDEGLTYRTASVCIPPVYVREAKDYVGDRLPICTVIGFPNGYMSTAAKVAETRAAVEDGADEIDMVIHLGAVKDGRFEQIEQEIRAVRAACDGRVLKVIIETCLLSEDEKVRMCEVVTRAEATYIKTSTGFSVGGATPEDVRLLRAHVGPHVKVKAAGGIASFEDAENFLSLGADRLGTSRLVKLAKSTNL